MPMKKWSSWLIILLIASNGWGQSLETTILEHMDNKNVSGLAAIIIQDSNIVWEGYYGLADRNLGKPVDTSTIFMMASISKTITATALMQLHEDGLFELDDAINEYLPFSVTPVSHPDADITFRQLLTHTSSIRDNWSVLIDLYTIGNSPLALGDFLEDYLSPGGDYYSSQSFYGYAPGGNANYSNVGAALCGYLVEAITGQPFNAYCHAQIFEPLCMDNTGWFLSELDTTLIARPYTYIFGTYYDQGLYGYPDYPDGQLRTTARSLAKFLGAYMQNGTLYGTTLLEESTVESMLEVHDADLDAIQGLMWYQWNLGGEPHWGHNGGDDGVSTDMYFNPATRTGYIVLTNGEAFNGPVINAMIDATADDLASATALQLDCNFTTEIPDVLPAVNWGVQPNPASDFTTISCSDCVMESIQVRDLTGKLLLEQNAAQPVQYWQMDVSTWSSGVYIITLFNDKGSSSKLFTKP